MLDNLANADLSGITGNIQYAYDSADTMMVDILGIIVATLFVVIITTALFRLRAGSKTKQYREKLTNMYVAATIRKFAKEDSLDLEEEYKRFIKESKKENLREEALSDVVENELSEKIVDKQEKKIEAAKQEKKSKK